MEEIKTKRCSKCGRILPLSAFSLAPKNPDGLRYHCKECCSKYQKEYNAKRKERRAERADDARRRILSEYTIQEVVDSLKARGCSGIVSYKEEQSKEMTIDGNTGTFKYEVTKEIEF